MSVPPPVTCLSPASCICPTMNAQGGHQRCHSMDHQVIMTNKPGFLGLPGTDTQVNMNEHRREFIKSHHLKNNIKVVKYSGIPVYPSPSTPISLLCSPLWWLHDQAGSLHAVEKLATVTVNSKFTAIYEQ